MYRKITIQDILSTFEKELGFSILGKTRDRQTADSRAAFYVLCRELTTYSYESIAKFANRHHATVIHGEKNVFPYLEAYNQQVFECYQTAKIKLLNDGEVTIHDKLNFLTEKRDKIELEIKQLKELI